MGVSLNYDEITDSYTNLYHWYDPWYSKVKCEVNDVPTIVELGTRDTSNYHTIEIQWRSSSEGYFSMDNGANTTLITTNVPEQGVHYLGVLFKSWDVDTLYADFVFVRKYTSPEPSWSNFGAWQRMSALQTVLQTLNFSQPVILTFLIQMVILLQFTSMKIQQVLGFSVRPIIV